MPAIASVRRMLNREPELYAAKVLAVGPDYTVEYREDLRKWEVMHNGGFVAHADYLDRAIEVVVELDELVTIPQDVSVLK